MATKNSPVNIALAVITHIASIVWFKETNRARQNGGYGTDKQQAELRESLAQRGWLQDDNGILKVELASEEYVTRGMRERQEQWDALKAAAKTDGNLVLNQTTFEEIYTKDGKLIPIKYLGVSGNRRSTQYFPAMVERRKSNIGPITTEVPIMIRTYENDLQRLSDQVDENEMKTLGFMEMTNVDRLLAAKTQVELGASQADLRRTFKDGTGQKLWGIVNLDKRFPNIGLIARMCKQPDEEGYIPFGSSSKNSDMATLLTRSDPKALEEVNAKKKTAGTALVAPADEAAIREHFETKKPKSNEPPIMKKENLSTLSENFPSVSHREVAKAILTNNVDILKQTHASAGEYNALTDIIRTGNGPEFGFVLAAVASHTNGLRKELIAELSRVCGEFEKKKTK